MEQDLFTLAVTSGLLWPRRWLDALAAVDDVRRAILVAFADHLDREGQLAFNMKARTLALFLASGVRKTVYDVADEESAITGQPAGDLVREKLGRWYEPRVAFDSVFEGAREFRYAALWLSGPGCQGYGPYCLILGRVPPRLSRAYVRGDTLRLHFSGAVFDFEAFTADLADEAHRRHLAAVKHSADLTDRRDEWGRCLCSERNHVEAILGGDPGIDSVTAALTTRPTVARHHDLAFRALTARLEPEERAELMDVNMVEERLRARRLRLEVTDD